MAFNHFFTVSWGRTPGWTGEGQRPRGRQEVPLLPGHSPPRSQSPVTDGWVVRWPWDHHVRICWRCIRRQALWYRSRLSCSNYCQLLLSGLWAVDMWGLTPLSSSAAATKTEDYNMFKGCCLQRKRLLSYANSLSVFTTPQSKRDLAGRVTLAIL